MCKEAGIVGCKTNHSLRATGASELFEAGVPEKIIKEQTGHRSLEALHIYEHATSMQHQAVSAILGSRNKITFQEAMCTPSVISHPTVSASSTPMPHNIFHNCSVQVIQTTQPPQLPPLPPPHSAPQTLVPPVVPNPVNVTQTDFPGYMDQLDFDLGELMNI